MSDAVKNKTVRWGVLLPPMAVIVAIIALNLVDYNGFIALMNAIIDWILKHFSWLFNSVSCATVVLVIFAYFSPIKNIRFGGSKARPLLGYANFVWIVLCTIMGSGLMLWTCAEPLYHIYDPPRNVVGGPLSGEAVRWAMENILLEWTWTPMAIYAMPTILFAFVFYNMRKPFVIGSMLDPILTKRKGGSLTLGVMSYVDCVCLFSVCMAMAASLGAGILLVAGGIEKMSAGRIVSNPALWVISGIIIVATFTIAASSGLRRGIQAISKINSWFYLILGIFVFVFGPTSYILDLCVESIGGYLSDFFRLSLNTSTVWGDDWSRRWPSFYWCIWMAWMPVSVIFLGRISRGFTVRETLNAVFVVPSVFSMIWIALFSCTTIHFELAGLKINEAMQESGIAAAAYAVLEQLPLPFIISPVFLITAFLSYVTSANSNTNAIAGLCTKGLTPDDSESPVIMKIIWGIAIGTLCVIMLVAYDIEGVKLLSYLGGFPTTFLMILFIACLIKIMLNPKKYDVFKEDYDNENRPLLSERLPYDKKTA
jgi:choline-glycine betaine transporter